MNILPKKRWHVRTKANIDRVHRDEAKALEEEKEADRRRLLAEQESRTAYLREKAGSNKSDTLSSSEETTSLVPKNVDTHVNFFQDLEDGKNVSGTNKEHEEEKRKEQEKLEKNIGLLTYLGQSALDQKDKTPWYLNPDRPSKTDGSSSQHTEVSNKMKTFLDPINDLKKYVGMIEDGKDAKKPPHPKQLFIEPALRKAVSTSAHSHEILSASKVHKKKHRKDKHKSRKKRKKSSRSSEEDSDASCGSKKKRKRRSHSSSSSSSSDLGEAKVSTPLKKSIEELRSERLKREQEERKKAEALLARISGKQPADAGKQNIPQFKQKYNSQFNPEFARQ